MREIWTVDCETDPFKYGRIPKPFLWGVYNGSEYHQFETTAECARFIAEVDGIFYAHNGGRFDYHFLIPYAEPYDDLLIIHGRLARWHLGRAELRDSFNILPIKLADYKKDDIDYSILEADQRNKPRNREKIESYLRADCMYLWELVNSFINRYGMSLTQASASMKLWRKMSGIRMEDSGATFFDRFKPWYYGGRVQAFEHGYKEQNFYVADVNSAYPKAMLHDHPFGLSPDTAPRSKSRIRGRDFYVVHGVVRGGFAFRDEEKLNLSFPEDGNARTYFVTGWELEAALEHDALDKRWEILERIAFTETVNFTDYIMTHYEARKIAKANGDKAGSLFNKLLMNSLYGKFGADPRNYTNHFIVNAASAPADDPLYPLAGYIGPWALIENLEKPNNSRFYNVATAASITGFQRAQLFRQIKKASGPLYCDTDCVAARDLGDIDLGDELGQWSLEKDEATGDPLHTWYAIAGRKLYAWGNDVGRKAVSKGRRDGQGKYDGLVKYASKGAKLYPDEIIKIAQGAMLEYHPDVPTFSVHKPPAFVDREIRLTR